MIRSKHTFRPVWRETVPRLWACEPRILNTLFEQSAHWCYQTSSEERAGRVRFCCTPAWRMKETTDRDSSSTRGDEHSNSLQAYLKKKKKSNYEQGLHSLLGGESEAWLHTHTHTHTHEVCFITGTWKRPHRTMPASSQNCWLLYSSLIGGAEVCEKERQQRRTSAVTSLVIYH